MLQSEVNFAHYLANGGFGWMNWGYWGMDGLLSALNTTGGAFLVIFLRFVKINTDWHMRIIVLGSTGRTGKLLTKLAIARNHQVTAIIRDKSQATLPKVKHLEGSLTNEQLLNEALQGADAVVVALNINRTSDNPFAKVTGRAGASDHIMPI